MSCAGCLVAAARCTISQHKRCTVQLAMQAVCSRLGGSWSQASLQPMLDLFLTCEALEIEPLSTAVIDIEEITSILQKVCTACLCLNCGWPLL